MDKRVSALLSDVDNDSREMTAAVEVLAKVTAEWMQKIHGGEWCIQIDHDCGLIMIEARSASYRRPIDPSSLREAI